MTHKKVLYIDMDNTLVDFRAALEGIHPDVLAEYKDREDEIPGIFALMPPMPGAVEAFAELDELFDVYILSTAPWKNPSAWQHKVEWVHKQLGMSKDTAAHKRLILSHHKNLNRGDFLVDDRPMHNGADKFEGHVVPFGAEEFETWDKVVAYLRKRAVSSAGDAEAAIDFGESPAPAHEPWVAARARRVAIPAHAGQPDKAGAPYWSHPMRVARNVRILYPDAPDEAVAVAWLHDVVEDTEWTEDALRKMGFSHDEVDPVVDAVLLLTRTDDVSDHDYYAAVRSAGGLALMVKHADITDNLNEERLSLLDPEVAAKLRTKYAKALDALGLPPRGELGGAKMRSALFDQAVAALEDAHAYPMLSREYMAGVQRAYQHLTLVATETADEEEREEAQNIADGLLMYLSVDWELVNDVEVRYRDGSTEVLRIRDDDTARERLRHASAIRVIEPLDYS